MATHPPGAPRPGRGADDDARHRDSELKTALRARYRARRRALAPELRAAQIAAVAEHVARFVATHHAPPAPPPQLGLYRAIRAELDPADVARRLEAHLGALPAPVFPRCEGAALVFAAAEPGGWVHGHFGLLEPAGAAVEPDGIDWLLMPALAVDARGNRLGYGGGFYDRFLAHHPGLVARTIAVVFDVQLAPDGQLPCEPFDVPVAFVASPDGVLRTCRTP